MDNLKQIIEDYKYYCNDIQSYAVPVSILKDYIETERQARELIEKMKELRDVTEELKNIVNADITRDTDQVSGAE